MLRYFTLLIITILNLAAPDYQSTLRFKHKANKQWFYLDCTSVYAFFWVFLPVFRYPFVLLRAEGHREIALPKKTEQNICTANAP